MASRITLDAQTFHDREALDLAHRAPGRDLREVAAATDAALTVHLADPDAGAADGARARAAAQGRVRSPAMSWSRVSRSRTTWTRSPSTITSAARGRVL